ncbi:MAG: amidophosphoribosyltransferase [Methylophaga sp.]|nr:MAG: amidophosphoribosyltransferase [Methylophaga sp.]
MDYLSKLTHGLTQLYSKLMPVPCLLCGSCSQQWPLCDACITQLPQLGNACPRCATPSPITIMCGKCLNQPPEQDLSFSLFHYQDPIDRLIIALKYHDKIFLTKLFAHLMSEQLQQRQLPQLLIPIPLHHRRLKMRGYNQSSELAKALSQQLSISTDQHCLIRNKNTDPQASLPYDQRKRNMHGAFTLIQPSVPQHVALIDDVLTTGHTVNAAATLLRQAGAATIEVWTIGRTIRHD